VEQTASATLAVLLTSKLSLVDGEVTALAAKAGTFTMMVFVTSVRLPGQLA
jgi:hypothetical protein